MQRPEGPHSSPPCRGKCPRATQEPCFVPVCEWKVTGDRTACSPCLAFTSESLTLGTAAWGCQRAPRLNVGADQARGRSQLQGRAGQGFGTHHTAAPGLRLGGEGEEQPLLPAHIQSSRAEHGTQGLLQSSPTRCRRWKANSNMVAARLWWMRYRGRRPCEESRGNRTRVRAAAQQPRGSGKALQDPCYGRPEGVGTGLQTAAGSCCCSQGVVGSGGGTEARFDFPKKPCTTQPAPPRPELHYLLRKSAQDLRGKAAAPGWEGGRC